MKPLEVEMNKEWPGDPRAMGWGVGQGCGGPLCWLQARPQLPTAPTSLPTGTCRRLCESGPGWAVGAAWFLIIFQNNRYLPFLLW